jgi:hypothetical protein
MPSQTLPAKTAKEAYEAGELQQIGRDGVLYVAQPIRSYRWFHIPEKSRTRETIERKKKKLLREAEDALVVRVEKTKKRSQQQESSATLIAEMPRAVATAVGKVEKVKEKAVDVVERAIEADVVNAKEVADVIAETTKLEKAEDKAIHTEKRSDAREVKKQAKRAEKAIDKASKAIEKREVALEMRADLAQRMDVPVADVPLSVVEAEIMQEQKKKPSVPSSSSTSSTAITKVERVLEKCEEAHAKADEAINQIAEIHVMKSGEIRRECPRLVGKKYEGRKWPPLSASCARNKVEPGLDGLIYISVPSSKDAEKWVWVKVTSKFGREGLKRLDNDDEKIAKLIEMAKMIEQAQAKLLESDGSSKSDLRDAEKIAKVVTKRVKKTKRKIDKEEKAVAEMVANGETPAQLMERTPAAQAAEEFRENVQDPEVLIKEAKKLMRKNVGITVEDLMRMLRDKYGGMWVYEQLDRIKNMMEKQPKKKLSRKERYEQWKEEINEKMNEIMVEISQDDGASVELLKNIGHELSKLLPWLLTGEIVQILRENYENNVSAMELSAVEKYLRKTFDFREIQQHPFEDVIGDIVNSDDEKFINDEEEAAADDDADADDDDADDADNDDDFKLPEPEWSAPEGNDLKEVLAEVPKDEREIFKQKMAEYTERWEEANEKDRSFETPEDIQQARKDLTRMNNETRDGNDADLYEYMIGEIMINYIAPNFPKPQIMPFAKWDLGIRVYMNEDGDYVFNKQALKLMDDVGDTDKMDYRTVLLRAAFQSEYAIRYRDVLNFEKDMDKLKAIDDKRDELLLQERKKKKKRASD